MKLDVLMHYEVDEQTGEITFIGKEEVAVDSIKKSVKNTSSPESSEPQLKLNANNFALNQAACAALGVSSGDTIHITYFKEGNSYVPVIGASEAFKIDAGNKLTKSLTVSFRGGANTRLAEYGNIFSLIKSTTEGVYFLHSDKIIETKQDTTIEVDDDLDLTELEDTDLDCFDLEDNDSKEITLDLTL